jgi:hypothetical protein
MPAVYPPRIVPPEHRGDYPHMAKRDAEVWSKFLARRAEEFLGFAYDVAVGGSTISTPDLPQAEIDGWRYNTALKIDVCGIQAARTWIIEVKPDATVSAVGAAIVYTMVCEREQVFDGELVPAIVCGFCHKDVLWAARKLGVEVIEVGV